MAVTSLLRLLPLAGTVLTMSSVEKNFRLPTDLFPSHYWLKLRPTFEDEGFITSGEVKISLRCSKPTDRVIFNQNGINITTVHLRSDSGESIKVKEQNIIEEKQMYELKLDSELKEGLIYNLHMSFSYPLNENLEGFYRSSYRDAAGSRRWLATTQFSPINARRAFPCWDEPSFKAKFTISLGRSSNMTSLSNMERINTTIMEGKEGWFWDHYQETLSMSTYLIAFIVCDLPSIDVANWTSPKFKVWSRKEILHEMDHLAFISPMLLSFISDYFQIPFPLNKVDLFAVPDFGFSAMENWGLVTFAESAVKNSKVIAHELAHQWFGNLVTPEWWEDLWLKEGFATFIGILALTRIDNSTEYMDSWIISELHHSMFEDSLEASHPVSNPVDDPRMIWQAFDAISYEKGSAIIRMMWDFLGESSFRAGLNSYLRRFAYRNARREQLWQAFDNISDINVGEVMDLWTLQVGYPVVTVIMDHKSGSVALKQERFLLSGKDDKNSETLWKIPVSYMTKSDSPGKRNLVWLEGREKTFMAENYNKSDWILANLEQTGYYRVNYDLENWNLLLDSFSELPRLSRVQLINDGFNLAISGLLPYDIPLSMVERINDVNDILLWNVTISELNDIIILLNGSPLLNDFKERVILLLHLESLRDSDAAKLAIENFAISLDDEHFVDMAINYTDMIINNKSSFPSIPRQKRAAIYCSSVKHGKPEIWKFYWKRFLVENDPEERRILLQSLTFSSSVDNLKKLLEALMSDDSGVKKDDAKFLFGSLVLNPLGSELALDFLIDKWAEIKERYGWGYKIISGMVLSFGRVLNQETQFQKLNELYERNINDLGSTSNAFKNTLERIKINISWHERNIPSIKNWIQRIK